MSTIDELITLADSDSRLLGAIQELAQLRESALRPATKYLTNTIDEQVNHINEEYVEVMTAYTNWVTLEIGKKHLIEELVDLQMSCETMLAILELNKEQRMEARIKVIAKNQARGYYDK